MLKELSYQLAYYEHMRLESEKAGSQDIADYWEAKKHGLSRGVEIMYGRWPIVYCIGEMFEVHIGSATEYFTF